MAVWMMDRTPDPRPGISSSGQLMACSPIYKSCLLYTSMPAVHLSHPAAPEDKDPISPAAVRILQRRYFFMKKLLALISDSYHEFKHCLLYTSICRSRAEETGAHIFRAEPTRPITMW